MSQVRYLFDENCNARILRGVRRRASRLDVVTVQEAGLGSGADPMILTFAAAEGRVMVSHDIRTMTAYATARLQAKEPMAGLIVIPQGYHVGQAIEELLLLAEVTTAEEWQGQIIFLPL